jgi:hypothetical protein
MKIPWSVSLLAFALCACTTPYGEMGLLGGVSATQIDANTLQIAARGNGYTGSDTIQRYVLLRAAEETAKRGFDLFLIVSSKDVTQTLYSVSSSGNSVSSSTHSVTMTTSSGLAIPVPLPGEDVLVKMFKGEKPADAPPNLYKASEVIQYVGPTVKRDP